MSETVAIVNKSSYQFDMERFIDGTRHYIRDIAREWGEDVWRVVDEFARHRFELTIVDELDQADALGYHDVGPDGQPYGLVGAAVTATQGVSLSGVITHELAEIIGDPLCIEWVANPGTGLFYARELADPTEGDLYQVDGYDMSNWVYPSYFNPFGQPPFDACGLIDAPFGLRPGGYEIVAQVGQEGQIVAQQRFGAEMPDWKQQAKSVRHPQERAFKRGVS